MQPDPPVSRLYAACAVAAALGAVIGLIWSIDDTLLAFGIFRVMPPVQLPIEYGVVAILFIISEYLRRKL